MWKVACLKMVHWPNVSLNHWSNHVVLQRSEESFAFDPKPVLLCFYSRSNRFINEMETAEIGCKQLDVQWPVMAVGDITTENSKHKTTRQGTITCIRRQVWARECVYERQREIGNNRRSKWQTRFESPQVQVQWHYITYHAIKCNFWNDLLLCEMEIFSGLDDDAVDNVDLLSISFRLTANGISLTDLWGDVWAVTVGPSTGGGEGIRQIFHFTSGRCN